MGILQKANYGSPKSRNVRSELERRPLRREPLALSTWIVSTPRLTTAFAAEHRRPSSGVASRQSMSRVQEVRVGEVGVPIPILHCEIWASRSSLFAKYPSIP